MLSDLYSVASANYEDELEFFSIKVQDGPLTSRLQHLKEGDEIIVSRKATGTLVIDNLADGRNLYLIGTGTGLAPFLSVIKDPETYDRFEKIVLLHGCRHVRELAYGEMITEKLPNDELIGEMVREQLIYYPTVTRDPFRNRGRITDLITSGKLFADIGLPAIEPAHDRVMICGSPALVACVCILSLPIHAIPTGFSSPSQPPACFAPTMPAKRGSRSTKDCTPNRFPMRRPRSATACIGSRCTARARTRSSCRSTGT